ncbi:MAG: sugar transferase [Candidatus Rokubacteria bacterium]|nr:sugar transferase [Candidatus Rokubacteria bacterium]
MVVKRIVDIAISAVVLLLLLPLFAVVAVAIKLDSPGPVFFRGWRVGRHGKPFRIYKYRSMVVGADRMGGPSTPADDPRITRMGRIVRKYNLDELAQFINVLKGDMSIVGPRPEVQHYVDMFTEEEKAILSVPPGITDWATVWIRDEGQILAGSPDPERAYMEKIRPEKLRLQLEYVRKRSLAVDLAIMLTTLRTHLIDRFAS